MLIDQRLADLFDRRIGQRPHRGGAGDVGRDAEHGADDEDDEARPGHPVVLHRERDEEERDGEDEADRREVVEDHVDVRPRLRRRAGRHIGPVLRRQVQLEVVDLPADLVGEDHQRDGGEGEAEDDVERRARPLLGVARDPQLVDRGGAGDHQREERHEARVIMGVHRVLGDTGFAGERLHRAGAAQVGRDREHREDAEQGETGPLERVIVGDDAGDEEAEHEHQSTGGEYADENVQMRPGLRDQMHVVPLTKYDNADGRACDLCPPQARFASRTAGPMWLRDDEGSRVPPPIARRGIRRDQRGRDQRGREDQRGHLIDAASLAALKIFCLTDRCKSAARGSRTFITIA